MGYGQLRLRTICVTDNMGYGQLTLGTICVKDNMGYGQKSMGHRQIFKTYYGTTDRPMDRNEVYTSRQVAAKNENYFNLNNNTLSKEKKEK